MGRVKTINDRDVLSKARQLFLKEGHAASTRQLSSVTGLSQPTLIQRFGSKTELFKRAMVPEALDVIWILGLSPEHSGGETKYHDLETTLRDIGYRLFTQVSERIPLILALRKNPDIDDATLDAAQANLGLPDLIDALSTQLWSLLGQTPAQATIQAEGLLLAAHGATLMSLSGADEDQCRQKVDSFIWTLLN